MFLPEKSTELTEQALELAKRCFNSAEQRKNLAAVWSNYLMGGSGDLSQPALLNKTGPHIERLHAYLFSPSDTRFMFDVGLRAAPIWQRREVELSRHLTKEFRASGVDLAFSDAVFWSLPLGASFLKLGIKTASEPLPEAADSSWLRSLFASKGKRRPLNRGVVSEQQQQVLAGFDPYVVLPTSMGVYNEAVNGLDRQEVIAHRTPITLQELWRRLRFNPDRDALMRKVQQSFSEKAEDNQQEFIHQVIIGGVNPVTSGTPTGVKGQVDVSLAAPLASVSPDVTRSMVWLVELWIVDDERGDYTTVQYVEPDILIEGGDQRRNLFIPGQHPFSLVQPNEQQGYFWGRSEFADLYQLQDAITNRLNDIVHIGRLQAMPPRGMMGFTGNIEEMKRAMQSRGGLLVSDMPTGKIEDLAPKMPETAFTDLDTMIRYFDQTAGFESVTMGQGDAGVRAGVHASTLARSASARIKNVALRVERQCAEVGALCFAVMQAKDPWEYGDKEKYLLDQVPEDHGIHVDAHSSSPAFSEDNKQLFFALKKADAITAEGLLLGVQPPMLDQLLAMLHDKQEKEAEMIRQHPELLTKGKRKR